MLVKFWGVRGSIATPGPTTVKYGGNTSCVEVRLDDHLLVLDAGTGIRLLGLDLLRRNTDGRIHLLISHPHWDHIQGLPFFLPAFREEFELNIYGYDSNNQELEKTLANQMDPVYFPVQMGDLRAKLNFTKVEEGSFYLNEAIRIDTIFLNHPGYNMAYRINYQGKTVVYATDNQPFGRTRNLGMWATEEYFNSLGSNKHDHIAVAFDDLNRRIIEFARGADLLIHDAQYTPGEFEEKVDWGHSPYPFAAQVASQAGVKHLVLFHHEPEHSDAMIGQMEQQAREALQEADHQIKCQAAYEGLELSL